MVAGAVVAYLLATLLGLVTMSKLVTDLQFSLADEKSRGGVTGDATELMALLAWLSLLAAGLTQLLASLVGGCVAGRA
ncbi:MAG: hypothetical protein ACRDTR_01355 [Rubrobacter sp.]